MKKPYLEATQKSTGIALLNPAEIGFQIQSSSLITRTVMDMVSDAGINLNFGYGVMRHIANGLYLSARQKFFPKKSTTLTPRQQPGFTGTLLSAIALFYVIPTLTSSFQYTTNEVLDLDSFVPDSSQYSYDVINHYLALQFAYYFARQLPDSIQFCSDALTSSETSLYWQHRLLGGNRSLNYARMLFSQNRRKEAEAVMTNSPAEYAQIIFADTVAKTVALLDDDPQAAHKLFLENSTYAAKYTSSVKEDSYAAQFTKHPVELFIALGFEHVAHLLQTALDKLDSSLCNSALNFCKFLITKLSGIQDTEQRNSYAAELASLTERAQSLLPCFIEFAKNPNEDNEQRFLVAVKQSKTNGWRPHSWLANFYIQKCKQLRATDFKTATQYFSKFSALMYKFLPFANQDVVGSTLKAYLSLRSGDTKFKTAQAWIIEANKCANAIQKYCYYQLALLHKPTSEQAQHIHTACATLITKVILPKETNPYIRGSLLQKAKLHLQTVDANADTTELDKKILDNNQQHEGIVSKYLATLTDDKVTTLYPSNFN